jgi:hemerythrin-like domain-containing protein
MSVTIVIEKEVNNMAVPLDAIRAIHNAFRKDVSVMDEAANAVAHGRSNLDLILKRYRFFNEFLVWHAEGEEEFVFPAIENVAPLISKPYEQDHRGLDSLFDWLDKAVGANDSIEIARVTAAFNFHLSIHLDKEEAHLYRVFNERVSLPNQGAIIGEMAQKIPQERFPEAVAWLYPLIGPDDRENMTRIWQQALPGSAFIKATELIRATIGTDWSELTRRIPELNSIGHG